VRAAAAAGASAGAWCTGAAADTAGKATVVTSR
jgi:hypothetical protein